MEKGIGTKSGDVLFELEERVTQKNETVKLNWSANRQQRMAEDKNFFSCISRRYSGGNGTRMAERRLMMEGITVGNGRGKELGWERKKVTVEKGVGRKDLLSTRDTQLPGGTK